MKKILYKKITIWLIGLLIIANSCTLIFFWVSHYNIQRKNSPKHFLANRLNFNNNQKKIYFDLAKEHNEQATILRDQIKINKDKFFELLKFDRINDSVRNNAALQISLSIQSLDSLTFEHFKKVRALCTGEQKPKFDDLIQRMVNSVNNSQQGPEPLIK